MIWRNVNMYVQKWKCYWNGNGIGKQKTHQKNIKLKETVNEMAWYYTVVRTMVPRDTLRNTEMPNKRRAAKHNMINLHLSCSIDFNIKWLLFYVLLFLLTHRAPILHCIALHLRGISKALNFLTHCTFNLFSSLVNNFRLLMPSTWIIPHCTYCWLWLPHTNLFTSADIIIHFGIVRFWQRPSSVVLYSITANTIRADCCWRCIVHCTFTSSFVFISLT